MRSLLVAILIAGLIIPVSPSHAREERRLEPSSQWVLDYAANSCRMARQFGEGESKVMLVMDQFAPGDFFTLTLVGESLKPQPRSRRMKSTVQFGPAEAESPLTGAEGLFDNVRSFIMYGSIRIAPLSPADVAAALAAERNGSYFEPKPIGAVREKAATWVAIRNLMNFDLLLHTGPMDKPIGALRECSWDLIGDWGLDVAQQKTLSRPATPKGHSWRWFSGDDYPDTMLKMEKQGIVHAVLLVDEMGKPSACHVQSSTRPKQFDNVVCSKLMQRAKFNPALDATGKPVKSYFLFSVSFRLG